MIGQPVFSVSFQRKDKAKSLVSKVSVKVAHDQTIDLSLLFQRFLVMPKTADMSLEDVLKYKLFQLHCSSQEKYFGNRISQN